MVEPAQMNCDFLLQYVVQQAETLEAGEKKNEVLAQAQPQVYS